MKYDFSNEKTLGILLVYPNTINQNALNFPSLIVPHFLSFAPTHTSLIEDRNCARASLKNTSRCWKILNRNTRSQKFLKIRKETTLDNLGYRRLKLSSRSWRFWISLGVLDWIESSKGLFPKKLLKPKASSKTEQVIMKKYFSFKRHNLIVSLKLSWNDHSMTITPFLSDYSHSKKPKSHNSLSSCCCSLFVTVSVCRQAIKVPQSNSNPSLSSL